MGVYLSTPNTAKKSSDGENSRIEFGTSAMQGWRSNMEDAHLAEMHLDNRHSLFGVFDGHGGVEVAKYCSIYLPNILANNQNYKNGNYEQALKESFIELDDVLLKDETGSILKEYKVSNEGMESYAGATANVVLVTETDIYVANTGDSRCYLYTKDKKLEMLSFDHKPDNDIEYKRIIEAGGTVSEGRVNENLNLSRAIGDLEYKRNANLKPEQQIISAMPDIVTRKITDDIGFLLMGCDGVWETLTAEEICEGIQQRLSQNPKVQLSVIVEELLDKLLAPDTVAGTGCDNMSAILFRFK